MDEKQGKRNIKDSLSRLNVIITLAINFILVIGLITCLVLYSNQTKDDAKEQNINNITSIAKSKAMQTETLLSSYNASIRSIYNYCNGKSLAEAMDYISNIHGASNEYQLLRLEEELVTNTIYNGYSTKKNGDDYIEVTYQSTSHAVLVAMFDSTTVDGEINFTSVFTNTTNGIKSFAPFCALTLTEAGVEYKYILMNPQVGSSLIERINVPSQYSTILTAVFDADGNYLAYEPGYKSLNFYDYLYAFNDLTLNEKNAIRSGVQGNEEGIGVLNYADSKNRDCTFVYAKFHTTADWYVSVCVQDSDYIEARSFGRYPSLIIILLLIMLIYDSLILLGIIKRLQLSVTNEKLANASKTDFLARMSHDIRTPMNGIMGLTDLTLEIKDLPEEARANLKSIASSNRYLVSLINDILDMNVISAGKMELHEETSTVDEIVTSVAQLSHSAIVDKSISFVMQKSLKSDKFVMMDKVRVKQILMNILSNAIKYTPVGGRIDFNCICTDSNDGNLHYEFIIKDTGVGMSEEFVNKIFEPFSREYNSMTTKYAGTGLGMAIVKTLVDLMDGHISIKSEKGKGTEVSISIDFTPAKAAMAGSTKNSSDYGILRGTRMLLVDDHPINIVIAKKMLEMYGVTVDTAEDGQQAVDKFAACEEDYYSAILMDIKMPVMDGIEATKIIRKMQRVDAQIIPIIAMTANAFAEDIVSTKNAGMNSHLAKPIDKDTLMAELAKHLNRRTKND